jgi:hypothetical protein
MTQKKALPEACSQKPILEFEGSILRPFDPWHLFLENPSGEGTTIPKAIFLGWIVKLFKEQF